MAAVGGARRPQGAAPRSPGPRLLDAPIDFLAGPAPAQASSRLVDAPRDFVARRQTPPPIPADLKNGPKAAERPQPQTRSVEKTRPASMEKAKLAKPEPLPPAKGHYVFQDGKYVFIEAPRPVPAPKRQALATPPPPAKAAKRSRSARPMPDAPDDKKARSRVSEEPAAAPSQVLEGQNHENSSPAMAAAHRRKETAPPRLIVRLKVPKSSSKKAAAPCKTRTRPPLLKITSDQSSDAAAYCSTTPAKGAAPEPAGPAAI